MLTADVSTRIKQLLLANADMSTNELKHVLNHEGFKASRMLVAFVATQWRHSLQLLRQHGLLTNVTTVATANPNTKSCRQCGLFFKPTRTDALFCSGRCRVAHHRAQLEHQPKPEPKPPAKSARVHTMRPTVQDYAVGIRRSRPHEGKHGDHDSFRVPRRSRKRPFVPWWDRCDADD
jgi:hypothetical protein